MRIALWIAAVLLGALFLVALIPWLAFRDLRRSGKGGEFLMIILTTAILFAVVLFKLLGS